MYNNRITDIPVVPTPSQTITGPDTMGAPIYPHSTDAFCLATRNKCHENTNDDADYIIN